MASKTPVEFADTERPHTVARVSSGNRGRPVADLVQEFETVAPQMVARKGLSSAAMRAGDLVRRMRKMAGLSQVELAARMGVQQARISEIESGAGSQGPTWNVMERVASVCGQTIGISSAVDDPFRTPSYAHAFGMDALIGSFGSKFKGDRYALAELSTATLGADFAESVYCTLVDYADKSGGASNLLKLNKLPGTTFLSVGIEGHYSATTDHGFSVIMEPVAVVGPRDALSAVPGLTLKDEVAGDG